MPYLVNMLLIQRTSFLRPPYDEEKEMKFEGAIIEDQGIKFAIVKVEKKEPVHLMPYEVAWKQIHDRLHSIEADQLRADHIQEITQKAKIESRPAIQRQFSRYFEAFSKRPNIYSVFE